VGRAHIITLIRIVRHVRFAGGEVLDGIRVAAAQDLDRRAGENGIAEPDVRLGDLHPDGVDRRMILQNNRRYPLGNRLGQADGFPLDDLPRPPVDLTVVNGLRQVVRATGGAQIQAQLHIHDEGLAQLALGGQRAVSSVEDHALQQYPVFGVFFAVGHPAQYKGP
jgi:hypothetical protein